MPGSPDWWSKFTQFQNKSFKANLSLPDLQTNECLQFIIKGLRVGQAPAVSNKNALHDLKIRSSESSTPDSQSNWVYVTLKENFSSSDEYTWFGIKMNSCYLYFFRPSIKNTEVISPPSSFCVHAEVRRKLLSKNRMSVARFEPAI